MLMRKHFLLAFTILFAVSAFAQEDQQNREAPESAITAAQEWLTLIDRENYAESYQQAGEYFKDQVEEQQWVDMVKQVRGKVGGKTGRTLKRSTVRTEIEKMPEGNYAIIQFDADFKNQQGVTETVTMAEDDEGEWHAIGYFMQ